MYKNRRLEENKTNEKNFQLSLQAQKIIKDINLHLMQHITQSYAVIQIFVSIRNKLNNKLINEIHFKQNWWRGYIPVDIRYKNN